MKRRGVPLTPLPWDASLSQVTPVTPSPTCCRVPSKICWCPFTLPEGGIPCESHVSCPECDHNGLARAGTQTIQVQCANL